MILEGCTGDVYAVAFYKDFVISSGYDMNIRVWDSFSGMLLKTLYGHTHIVKSLAIKDAESPLIVSGSWDHTVCVWSLESGKLISKLIGHSSRVKAVSISNFSPEIILSGGEDRTVKLWNLNSSEPIFTLDGPHNVLSLAIGECKPKPQHNKKKACDKSNIVFDSKYLLAAGGTDHYIRLWNSSGILHKELRGHQQDITSLLFIHDEVEGAVVLLLSSSNDWTIRLWNAVTGFALRVFRRHYSNIISCSLCHRFGKTLIVSLSSDGNIQIWNLASNETVIAINKDTKKNIISFATSSIFIGNRLQIVLGGSEGHLELFAVECPSLFVHKNDDDEKNSQLDMSIFNTPRKIKANHVRRSVSDDRSKNTKRTQPPVLPLPVLTTRARALALEPKPPSPYSMAGTQLQSPRQLLLTPHAPISPRGRQIMHTTTTLQKNNKSPKKYKIINDSEILNITLPLKDGYARNQSKRSYPSGAFNDELDSSSMYSAKLANQLEIEESVDTQSIADILRAGGIPIDDDTSDTMYSNRPSPDFIVSPNSLSMRYSHHHHRASRQVQDSSPSPRPISDKFSQLYEHNHSPSQPQSELSYAHNNFNLKQAAVAPSHRTSPSYNEPGRRQQRLFSLEGSGGKSPTSPSLNLSYRWDINASTNTNKDFSLGRPIDNSSTTMSTAINHQQLRKQFHIKNPVYFKNK